MTRRPGAPEAWRAERGVQSHGLPGLRGRERACRACGGRWGPLGPGDCEPRVRESASSLPSRPRRLRAASACVGVLPPVSRPLYSALTGCLAQKDLRRRARVGAHPVNCGSEGFSRGPWTSPWDRVRIDLQRACWVQRVLIRLKCSPVSPHPSHPRP